MRIAKTIGKYKSIGGITIVNTKIEDEIIDRVKRYATERNISGSLMRDVFRALIDGSVNIQNNNDDKFEDFIFYDSLRHGNFEPQRLSKLRIGFQGEYGAFSDLAIRSNFPNSISIPCAKFSTTFDVLDNSAIDYAHVPIENSQAGSILEVFKLLERRDVKIVYEIVFQVNHMLIGFSNLEKINRVYSHPQALVQCKTFIQNNNLQSIEFHDTAGSVRHIKDNQLTNAAAIASERAAELYGMEIIERNIQDIKHNLTRFLLIGK